MDILKNPAPAEYGPHEELGPRMIAELGYPDTVLDMEIRFNDKAVLGRNMAIILIVPRPKP
jgi:hypothetical protein